MILSILNVLLCAQVEQLKVYFVLFKYIKMY